MVTSAWVLVGRLMHNRDVEQTAGCDYSCTTVAQLAIGFDKIKIELLVSLSPSGTWGKAKNFFWVKFLYVEIYKHIKKVSSSKILYKFFDAQIHVLFSSHVFSK